MIGGKQYKADSKYSTPVQGEAIIRCQADLDAADALDAESLSAYLPDDTHDNPGLAMGLQAAIGRVAALKAEYDILRKKSIDIEIELLEVIGIAAARRTEIEAAGEQIKELKKANHDLRNAVSVPQMRVNLLQAALADLLTAINAIPYNYIVISYLERIEPEMERAGEVMRAVGEGKAV